MAPAAPASTDFPETALITLRLPGSLPAAVMRALKAELREAYAAGLDEHRARKQLFARFDAALDQGSGSGPQYLGEEKIAEVLAAEFEMLPETGFLVPGFVIRPNHAHVFVQLPATSRLSFAKSLDLLQQRTEAAGRRLVRPRLHPETPFWQPGWHEVPLRDDAELARALAYLQTQSRQAGLPARFSQWPYVAEE